MRPRLSVALTALVLLVLLQAHRILLTSVILDAAAGLAPPVRPFLVAAALLPVLLLALPALPLPLGRDRRTTVALSAVVAGAARVVAASPQSHAAGLAAAVAMAAAAVYLGAGVGLLARRAVAGGAACAIALDELVRWLLEPTALAHRAIRLALPLLLAALIVALALAARRTEATAGEGPERRAGGLRLRGALALGAILFLETSILAAPAVAARRAGLERDLIGAALAAAAAGAAIWLMAGGGPARLYRPRLVAMGALAAAAGILVGPLRGPAAGLLLLAGHLCCLLLLGRALAPASGRRGTWTAAGTLAMLALLDGALAVATAAPPELAPSTVPWVQALAAVVLTGALVLIPRPAPAEPLLPRSLAGAALALGVLVASALAVAAGRESAVTQLQDVVHTVFAGLASGSGGRHPRAPALPGAGGHTSARAKEVPGTHPIAYNTLARGQAERPR